MFLLIPVGLLVLWIGWEICHPLKLDQTRGIDDHAGKSFL
jgi:hypothetical protein